MKSAAVWLAWAVAWGLLAARPAGAQDEATIRLVVPAPAGGNMDGTARLIAPLLAKRLNAAVVVDNKPGASTMVGTEWVAKAPADGRTLLMAGVSFSTNAVLYPQRFDPFRDLRPVAQLSRERLVLAVRKDLAAHSLAELTALARATPGGLNCAAAPGVAGMGCSLLSYVMGEAVVPIPFSGVAPQVTNLLGGQVDLAFIPPEFALQHGLGGRIRLLAVAGDERLQGPLAGLPRMVDTWPAFSLDGYLGVLVAGKTANDTVERLNEAVNFALADPAVRERMQSAQQAIVGGSPAHFEAQIRDRYTHYKRIIELARIQAP